MWPSPPRTMRSNRIDPGRSERPVSYELQQSFDLDAFQFDTHNMATRCGTRRCARSGMTAVLAMLYLTLMASLALGFYSASNTAVLVSANEQRVERARLAAESGLDFARFNLSKVAIPAKSPIAKHFSTMCDQMSTKLNGSGNLDNGSIYTDGVTIVRVPADPNRFIKSDERGSEFQFTITDISESHGPKV